MALDVASNGDRVLGIFLAGDRKLIFDVERSRFVVRLVPLVGVDVIQRRSKDFALSSMEKVALVPVDRVLLLVRFFVATLVPLPLLLPDG